MKKIIYSFVILIMLFCIVACGEQEQDMDKVIVNDKNFITQMEGIYYNVESYIGKVIEIEGFVQDVNIDAKTFGIVRKYNCCEDEISLIGLDCKYEGELPKENDWIKVTGVISKEYEKEEYYPSIKVENLEIQPIRGNEMVYGE